MSESPRIDEEALLELREVMEDEFAVLIETFIADSRTRIQRLWAILESGDAEEFRKMSHSLKGSCINIGAPRLGELCLESETLGKESRLKEARPCLEAIEAEFAKVTETLERFVGRP